MLAGELLEGGRYWKWRATRERRGGAAWFSAMRHSATYYRMATEKMKTYRFVIKEKG